MSSAGVGNESASVMTNITSQDEGKQTTSGSTSAGGTFKREYVAGDSVEFDFTDEKQQSAEEQSQMELF